MKHLPTKFVPDSLIVTKTSSELDLIQQKTEEIAKSLSSLIGSPYYAKNGFILYKGDFVKLGQRTLSSSFKADLIVTSPPYNIGKEYEINKEVSEYVDWCRKWMGIVYAMTKKNGTFWLNVGHLEVPGKGKCVPIPYLLWDKSEFFLLQEVIWTYGAGVHTKKRLSPRNEKWMLYLKDPENYVFNLDEIRDPNVKYPNQKKNGKLKNNPLGKNPSDVWDIPKITTGGNRSSKERTDHPAQFPLRVIERTIKASSNDLDIVMDPFLGSGTTAIASVALGRVCLGFEIDKGYCDMAIKRFEKFLDYRDEELKQKKLEF